MAVWKDTSSFSQGVKERIPNCFETNFGKFRVVVHRHRLYPQDVWLARCYPEVFDMRQLKSKEISEAQCEAAAMLQMYLEDAVRAITAFAAEVEGVPT